MGRNAFELWYYFTCKTPRGVSVCSLPPEAALQRFPVWCLPVSDMTAGGRGLIMGGATTSCQSLAPLSQPEGFSVLGETHLVWFISVSMAWLHPLWVSGSLELLSMVSASREEKITNTPNTCVN